jgi:hypothetical protein
MPRDNRKETVLKNQKRPYQPLDNAFLDQDTIQALGESFGAAGPLVMIALIGAVGEAIPRKTKDFDIAEGRYAALARRTYVNVDTVKAIFQLAVDQGLLEILESDDVSFKVRLLKFYRWNAKDPTAKDRKAKQRDRERADV